MSRRPFFKEMNFLKRILDSKENDLFRCASISWIHDGEWVINDFEILSNLGHIIRVCSECVQSVLRVCSECA